jgi:Tfp pilus tip-associated adhesin PilY1
VPGYSATGPVTDTYIGWPQRLSAYPVDPITGVVSGAPVWESDWSSKVSASSCGPTVLGAPDVALLGPGGNFRNGVGRNVNITTPIDRNGDGTPDPIPPTSGGYTWGRSYGFAATEPVVVDAPREALGGQQSATFSAHQAATRTRKRAIYVQAGGYVLGYDGGDYDPSPITYTGGTPPVQQLLAFQYRETGSTGAEIMRFTPNWLNDPNADYQYGLNDLIQQPILSGDLEAREVFDGTQWRTVLAGSAGPSGRGFFTLDITNPCATTVLGQWTLPNAADRASNEPRIYTVPTTSGPRPALIVTGGLNGTSSLYAYRLDGTNHYAAFNLQSAGGASYAVTPVCVDARGEGCVTHCYALRSDGHLSRVAVTQAGFGSEVDITPTGGSTNPIGGGRTYFTMPVAFFSADGNVNLVFGSGDFENLTTASVQNYVFKVTDEAVRKKALPNTAADVTTTCYPAGGTGPTEGVFALAAGERMIASPVVVAGGVFWTAYTSSNNGCIAGSGALYGMNFESCYDVFTPGPNRPTARAQGPGIPLTPTIHRRSNEVITQSTASPTPSNMGSELAKLRGGQKPVVKRLYWRPSLDMR